MGHAALVEREVKGEAGIGRAVAPGGQRCGRYRLAGVAGPLRRRSLLGNREHVQAESRLVPLERLDEVDDQVFRPVPPGPDREVRIARRLERAIAADLVEKPGARGAGHVAHELESEKT